MPQIYDISPLVHAATAVFPGDVAFKRKVSMDTAQGDHLTLSSIETTVHIGAHTDAPNHYGGEQGIDAIDLEVYWGPCQVVSVPTEKGGVVAANILDELNISAPRVLFRTGSFPDPDHFNEDFMALTPELILELSQRGVRLVGIDTPSIDRVDSKSLPTHHAVLKTGMAILESIVLNAVPDGNYELVCLPLKLAGADASPVRAVLRT